MDAVLAVGATDHLLIKLVFAIVGAGMVFGVPLAGFLIKRFGYRPVMTGASLLFASAGCAPFVLSNLHLIVANRFLVGAASGAIQISAVTLAGDFFQAERRAKLLGYMVAVGSLAGVIGTPLSGLLGSVTWRAPFLLHAIALPMAAMAFLSLAKLGPQRTKQLTNAGHVEDEEEHFSRWTVAILAFVIGLVGILPAIYFVFRLREIGIASPSVIGFSLLAISIPEILTSLCYGELRKRLSADAIFVGGFAFAACGISTVACVHAYYFIVFGMMLYGPSLSLLGSNLYNVAASDSSNRGGSVGLVSTTLMALYSSTVLGVVSVEAIFQRLGAEGVLFVFAALAFALGALFLIRIFSTSRRPHENL
jgi:predicted MFS family arabinose efflux permease